MYEIEASKYKDFLAAWERADFEQQRLGQAFYNYFKLHSLTDQASLLGLYEANGDAAVELIQRCFLIR